MVRPKLVKAHIRTIFGLLIMTRLPAAILTETKWPYCFDHS